MNIAEQIRRANIEVHRKEAAIYDLIHPEIFNSYEQSRIERDLYLITVSLPKGNSKNVLDIGCGTGNLTVKFAKMGYKVKAVDISDAMIAVLDAKLDSSIVDNVERIIGDAEEFLSSGNASGEWDIISFSSVLHHLPDYESAVLTAVKKLRPGGILYVCHEPLASKDSEHKIGSFWENMINLIDLFYIYLVKSCVYFRMAVREKTFPTRIDYSLSDYHVERGINMSCIVEHFNSIGAKVIFFETYCSHFCQLLTRLDHVFKISSHSMFRMIVQRDL